MANKKDYGTHDDDASASSGNFSDVDVSEDIPSSAFSAEETSQSEELAQKESRAVFGLRVIVIVVLCLAAIAITLVVWFTTSKAEHEDFMTNFDGVATKVLKSFEEIVGQKLGAVAGLGVSLTAYARSVNATWPFVTMNDYQQRAASARSLSGTLFIELLPIVTGENRKAWEAYSVANKGWLDEGRAYQDRIGMSLFSNDAGGANTAGTATRRKLSDNDESGSNATDPNALNFVTGDSGDSPIADQIWMFGENWEMKAVPDKEGPFFPIWLSSPILVAPRELANWDVLYYPDYADYVKFSTATGKATFGGIDTTHRGNITDDELVASYYAFLLSYAAGESVYYNGDPMSSFYVPVFDTFDEDRKVVAILLGVLQWASYFEGVLPVNSPAVDVVLENNCQGAFTYRVRPTSVDFLGAGDLHNKKYDALEQEASFDDLIAIGQNGAANGNKDNVNLGLDFKQELCKYNIRVFATEEFEQAYKTHMPAVITSLVGAVFLFAICMFFVYDRLVERRQTLVLNTAKQTTAIVSQLFPAQIKDRLMEQAQGGQGLKGFMKDGAMTDVGGKPLADLFLETTVLFADIQGFTAWSSVREPSQVFTLLETLYASFDKIAKRRRIYKVETVADCYVAVCGLPEARSDHAPAMCRFAADVVARMHVLTKHLEVTLGPGTGELGLRVGIHSGPVTAGVLRGERARFQLFGDTMNTCSRIESTGLPGRVHCSVETAQLIKQAGKEVWLEKRSDTVLAKGLGCIETYWVNCHGSGREGSVADLSSNEDAIDLSPSPNAIPGLDDRKRRLIDWNTEMLLGLIKQIVAQRDEVAGKERRVGGHKIMPANTPLEEVREIIALPEFCHRKGAKAKNPEEVVIPPQVVEELRQYVTYVSSLYRDNPFHNFEHASHVMMSVTKTLSRIVRPDHLDAADLQDQNKVAATLHDHTYGITSDPLIQFACAFSALIHDADHTGVSNAQLVNENDPLCTKYSDRSVAEQNSLDLSWELLMRPEYINLRDLLFPTKEELVRFRQLVVNSVMATDIVDKEMKELRNNRWDKAFKKGDNTHHVDENPRDELNRKATIVIEHIIQASDISHTMQHWHVYRKWNQNLFSELYVAYLNGRMEKDPAEFWYKGEIGFFDFYIIPLTQKLKDCGVFGVSSGEFLNYALKNREEWVNKGEQVVAEMIQIVRQKYGDKDTGLKPLALQGSTDHSRRPWLPSPPVSAPTTTTTTTSKPKSQRASGAVATNESASQVVRNSSRNRNTSAPIETDVWV